jgi:3-hydroxybutyryl-CoA dehydrogenase
MSDIRNVTVIGAGQMGNGICHVFAQHGYKVTLMDVNQIALDKALATISKNMDRQIAKQTFTEEEKVKCIGNIATSTSVSHAVKTADLVIEAATENIELKLNIFREIDENAPQGCILASNTSSISITKIAAVTKRPDFVIGMHFMNPVPVMKLVEIINGYSTSKAVVQRIFDLSTALGKIPSVVNDYPGFIANRILMPLINEAIYSVYEGIAGVEEIDTITKLGLAHPMGTLQLADFIGLDTCLSIMRVLENGFGNPKYAPCPLLVNMVTAGKLGVKSGEGFYKYTAGSKETEIADMFKRKSLYVELGKEVDV